MYNVYHVVLIFSYQIENNGNIVTDGHKRYYCQQEPGHYGSEPKPFCELKQ